MSRKKNKLPLGSKLGDLCSNTLFATVQHYFSSFTKMLEPAEDFRQQGKVKYSTDTMLLLGVIQRLIGARTNNEFEGILRTSSEIENNIFNLLGLSCEELPSIDNLCYFFQNLSPRELHKIRRQMLATLERKKF